MLSIRAKHLLLQAHGLSMPSSYGERFVHNFPESRPTRPNIGGAALAGVLANPWR
jgi:hypothetical protein